MRNGNLPFTYCFFRFWRSGRHSRPRLCHVALPTSGPRCCCTGWRDSGVEQRLSPCVVGEGQYVWFGERRIVREHAEITLRRIRRRVGRHGLTRRRQSVMEDVRSAWLSSCRRLERSTRGIGREEAACLFYMAHTFVRASFCRRAGIFVSSHDSRSTCRSCAGHARKEASW